MAQCEYDDIKSNAAAVLCPFISGILIGGKLYAKHSIFLYQAAKCVVCLVCVVATLMGSEFLP